MTKKRIYDTSDDEIIRVSGLCKDIEYIKSELIEIKANLNNRFVTNVEFDPIKKIVYGMVSVLLIGVIGALLALVLRTP